MPKLKELDHIDGDSIQSISDQLRHQVESFESALAARRKALEDAITIHTLTEKVVIILLLFHFYCMPSGNYVVSEGD